MIVRACIGLLLICAVSSGCAREQAPILIADGRTGVPTADASQWAASPAVQQAIAAARVHWSESQPGFDEQVHVLGVASGAFTRKGAGQHAVLYSMSDVPRGFPSRGLAVVEDAELIANYAFTGLHAGVRALPDIDGDGHDELVFDASFGMGGQTSSGVTLVAPGSAGLRDLWTESTYESICAARPGGEGPTARRITVVPGSKPMIEQFEKDSCESEDWRARGAPEPLSVIADDGTVYTDIFRR